MKKYKISSEEFGKVSYKRLANSPGANSRYGESTLKGEELKARMDEPFELFMAKFNQLVSLIVGTPEGDSLTKNIPTGISETHTLYDLICDVVSEGGEFASYLSVGDKTLLEKLADLKSSIDTVSKRCADDAETLSKRVEEELKRMVPRMAPTDEMRAYVAEEGYESSVPVFVEPQADSLVMRDYKGRIKSKAPLSEEDVVNLAFLVAGYIANRGTQILDGSLSISGELFVGGSAKAKELESLEVSTACIVANSAGIPLAELSGYVIRVNGDSAYAIAYDPFEQCVKIGLGTYNNEAHSFAFGEGQAQSLATRADINHLHVPIWDNVKKTFIDSDIPFEALIKKRGELEDGEVPVWDGASGTVVGSGRKAQALALREEVAGALKGRASGAVVALKDVSRVGHNVKYKVVRKNLFPTNNDLELLSGSEVAGTEGSNYYGFAFRGLPKGLYTLSATRTDGGTNSLYVYCSDGISEGKNFTNRDYNKKVFDIPEGGNLFVYSGNPTSSQAYGSLEAVINKFNAFEFQLEPGATATAYTPYIADIEAAKVRVQGKNLINPDLWNDTFDKQEDGSYLSNTTISPSNTTKDFFLPSGIYTISYYIKCESGKNYSFRLCYVDDTYEDLFVQSNGGYVYGKDTTNGKAIKAIQFYLGETSNNVQFKDLQIEADHASEYEPYVAPVEYAQGEAIESIHPGMTITTDTEGALVEVEYNRDINKAFEEITNAIISIGGYL